MMIHGSKLAKKPTRVVVLGGGGFIAGAIRRRLDANGIATLALGRPTLDLLTENAATQLAEILKPDDVLIVASAKAPCKDLTTLCENLVMAEVVCTALQKRAVAQVIYLSSDAVYKDSEKPLTEESCAAPDTLHGVMHLAREIALRQAYSGPLSLLRPTLVYGLNDPHNGYGPNRFRRLAAAGEDIVLFGEGEERRDHVDVDDVAELTRLIVMHRSAGVINAVSGHVVSFRELAEFAAGAFAPAVVVRGTARNSPMPHNGYRAFDNSSVQALFPGFKFKSWREGLSAINKRQKPVGSS
jgi:UDP-glucose 4-epimerase